MDYKLRLDVDIKKLERDLAAMFKKTGWSSMVSGGSSSKSDFNYSKDIGSAFNKVITSLDKLAKSNDDLGRTFSKGQTKTVNIIHSKNLDIAKKIVDYQNAATRETQKRRHDDRITEENFSRMRQTKMKNLAARNAMLRRGGVGGGDFRNMGGFVGGSFGAVGGTLLDMFIEWKQPFKGKAPPGFKGAAEQVLGKRKAKPLIEMAEAQDAAKKKIPQIVKIGGIVAGLAGVAGLGKLIIDSSPVLQSMLKLLNVGIMLILRPIGDFIGFMLRPLLIQFVKEVAIPAYKDGAGLAKKWGTKLGGQLLQFINNPLGTLGTMIVTALGTFFGLRKDEPMISKDLQNEMMFEAYGGQMPDEPPVLSPDQASSGFDIQKLLMQPLLFFAGKWNVFFMVQLPTLLDNLHTNVTSTFNKLINVFTKSIPAAFKTFTEGFYMFIGKTNMVFQKTIPTLFKDIVTGIGSKLKSIPELFKKMAISIGSTLKSIAPKLLEWLRIGFNEITFPDQNIPGTGTKPGTVNPGTIPGTNKPGSVSKDATGNLSGGAKGGFKWPDLKTLFDDFSKKIMGNWTGGGIKGAAGRMGPTMAIEALFWQFVDPYLGEVFPEYGKHREWRESEGDKNWNAMVDWFNKTFNQTPMPKFNDAIEDSTDELEALGPVTQNGVDVMSDHNDATFNATTGTYSLTYAQGSLLDKIKYSDEMIGMYAKSTDNIRNKITSTTISLNNFKSAIDALLSSIEESEESEDSGDSGSTVDYGYIYGKPYGIGDGDGTGEPYQPYTPDYGPFPKMPRSPYPNYANPDFGAPFQPDPPVITLSPRAREILDEYDKFTGGPPTSSCPNFCMYNDEAVESTSDTTETWRDIDSYVQMQEDHAMQTRINSEKSKNHQSNVTKNYLNIKNMSCMALDYQTKILDTYSKVHENVTKTMAQLSGMTYTTSEGQTKRYQDATIAGDTLNQLPNAYKQEPDQDPLYRVTWVDGTTKTMRLNAEAASFYRSLSVDKRGGPKAVISGVKRLASGGIISEKIFGVGESGRQYLMGEAGPETITPGANVQNSITGGSPNITINITANNINDIERQLKPTLLRILKESTSRAGIV